LRIQEYAKRPEATQEWNKLGLQVTIVGIDNHLWNKWPPGYDEVNAFETVEILWGDIEVKSVAGEPDKYRHWDLALGYLAGMFDGPGIWQGDPNSPFARLLANNTFAECKTLIVPFREWIFRNLRYCYFHPKEKHLKLDLEARVKGIPSKQYRQSHPWGANDGPNLTDPKKIPGANFKM